MHSRRLSCLSSARPRLATAQWPGRCPFPARISRLARDFPTWPTGAWGKPSVMIETLLARVDPSEPDPASECPRSEFFPTCCRLPRIPKMSTRIIQVDSFTDRPFAGNPAAVCLLDAPAPEPWMQHVASEMNLSETAFVHPIEPGSPVSSALVHSPRGSRSVRSRHSGGGARALGRKGAPSASPCSVRDPQRPARARRQGDWIELDFPAEPIAHLNHRPKSSSIGSEPR